jgi:PAS domain-containing protein
MHKTLARQVAHHINDPSLVSSPWTELLDAVSTTYEGFDQDRLLIERSLEISSRELKGLIALLQATLDSIGEGILVINSSGQMINHNKRFLEIWDIPEEIMKTHDNEKAITYVLDKIIDPIGFRKNINNAFANAVNNSAYVVKFKDGKIVEMNSRPQLVDGENVGRVWSFRDITLHLITEEELKTKLSALERLNKAMIDRELKMVELKKKIVSLESMIASQSGE